MSYPETSKPYSGKNEGKLPGSSSSYLARKHHQLPTLNSASKYPKEFVDQSILDNSDFM